MTPVNVFQIDLASRATPRRSLLMRLGLPMLLALPFALAAMPPWAKACGMAMLILFLAFFGSAVAAVRRRTDGLAERLRTLPIPRSLVALDLLLAGASMDLVQTAGPVALLLIVGAKNIDPAGVLVLAGLLVVNIVLLNALGMALAAAMKGNPEVHLAGALAVGLLAAGSGLFPLGERLTGVIAPSLPYNPISRLAYALAQSVEGMLDVTGCQLAAAAAVLACVLAAMILRAANRPAPKLRGRERP